MFKILPNIKTKQNIDLLFPKWRNFAKLVTLVSIYNFNFGKALTIAFFDHSCFSGVYEIVVAAIIGKVRTKTFSVKNKNFDLGGDHLFSRLMLWFCFYFIFQAFVVNSFTAGFVQNVQNGFLPKKESKNCTQKILILFV